MSKLENFLNEIDTEKDLEIFEEEYVMPTADELIAKQEREEKYGLEEGSEILSKEFPPEEWLVNRILPIEGFTFITGAEATGKSFYTLTLANSIVTGEKWLNQFEVKKTGKVLIIDKENTKRRTQTRMRGLKMDGKNIFWLKYPQYFELLNKENPDGFSDFARIASEQVKEKEISLVIIDSFADVMVGNENAAGEVQIFFDAIRRLFPGIAILVLHHANKPMAGLQRTASQRTRGSTNIMAQVYSAFYVEAQPKSKTEFIFEQTKAGDSEKLNKFMVELCSEPDSADLEKTVVTQIAYRGEVADDELKVKQAQGEIEEMFKTSNLIPRQNLLDILTSKGYSTATIKRAVDEFIKVEIMDSIPNVNDKRKIDYFWKDTPFDDKPPEYSI